MKNLVILLICLSVAMQAEALLPPLYQTSAEIQAILSHDQLGHKLQSGEGILKIEKNDAGYEIITNRHRLQVYVEYEAAKQPGPARYQLHFGEPQVL